ncbi:metallophosphoesterase [Hymenobacter busanensis]|uniref:Metallophosphoesterase n=1 Tax=Hymenobacter busanensis TaxID=2607656 RepID=A0A7L5A2I8_9BACT|nr:metallophosphoesterase [Hymenobacter busanensis]KAA9333331.1 metallophosphoesterase [Hymenobacter busanensis]QHJ07990.1 metallophosphoesterase [Hymenobacter busanensis]
MPHVSAFSFLSSWAGRGLGALLLTGLLGGCDLLEFSPNETRTPEEYRNLTRKNLDALAARPNPSRGDTLRFVFIGDSQRFYGEAEDFVRSVNQQPDVAFVLVAGDISDFGLVREMRWVDERLRKLRVPYLTVIGNHDHVANGRGAYEQVYGPLNYAFTYADTRFVLLDTNGREAGFNGTLPNIPWLESTLADTGGARRQIVVSHVPPFDGDFDPQLEQPYVEALARAPRLVFELNGHRHDFGVDYPYENNIPFINSYSFEKREYTLLTLWGDRGFRLDNISY